jgi:GAF domain-containing protein
VPIKFGNKIIGVLDVESDVCDAFHPQDVATMVSLADQVAIAIENARLFGERERRIRELDVLIRVGQSLSDIAQPSRLWEFTYEQVGVLVDASDFFVAIYGPDDGTLRMALAVDQGRRLDPVTLPYHAGEGLLSWVIENKRPLLIRDWLRDDLGLADRVTMRTRERLRSWLGVPLICRGRVLGVMGVQSSVPDAFDERQQTILAVVGAQLAMAFDSLESQDGGE